MTDQASDITSQIITQIEASSTKSVRMDDGTVYAKTTEGKLVIANKGKVILSQMWEGAKQVAKYIYKWVKYAMAKIVGWLALAMAWLTRMLLNVAEWCNTTSIQKDAQEEACNS